MTVSDSKQFQSIYDSVIKKNKWEGGGEQEQ